MALGHYMYQKFGKSIKSKGSSPAESTNRTDTNDVAQQCEGKAWGLEFEIPLVRKN